MSRHLTFGMGVTLKQIFLSMLAGTLVGLQPEAHAGPTNLVLRGSWPEPSSASAVAVAVAGHYAYVANGIGGLAILDVGDPAHPVRVGGYPTPTYAHGVYALSHYVYLADESGMFILDVTDPTQPAPVGSLDPRISFRTAQALGDLLYLAAANLKILNVSNPASPVLVVDLDIMGNALDLQIVGDSIYFAGDLWWSVYNITDPIRPAWVSIRQMAPFVNGIAVNNHHAYVAEQTTLHVFDVQDQAHPVAVDNQTLNGRIADLEVVENTLFVAHAEGGVSVFDLSDPARPVRTTGYDTGFPEDLLVVGNYVLVANGYGGLVILESQPLRLPALTIMGNDTNAVLRWPASALGFLLESCSDLNTSNWFPIPTPPEVEGEVFSLSRAARGNEYFRLHRRN
ncbi:MAG: hypothetical protein IH623_31650 [Verrucomicrobia bacterium]|nr:hypothetical protein [Verrucomicrobiota bacterium]